MKTLYYRITGETPLLMHNGQMADKKNPFVVEIKKLTSKKKNTTEADEDRITELEFLGGLYLKNGEPCIPGEVFEATIKEGAKAEKLGATFIKAVQCPKDFPLQYDGPKKLDELFKDERYRFRRIVRIQQSKTPTTRPIFPVPWWAEVEIQFDERLVDETQVERAIVFAGEYGYLMDWRGKFGHYRAEKMNGNVNSEPPRRRRV